MTIEETLRDFAENGTRFDLTPTMQIGPNVSAKYVKDFLLDYIKRIDESVRARAKEAITGKPDPGFRPVMRGSVIARG